MLELSTIGFSVETKPLEDAANKVKQLGEAVSTLAVSLKELDKASTSQVKSQKDQAKAVNDTVKITEEQSKQVNKTVQSMDGATKVVEKQTLAMKIFRGETVALNDEVVTLGSSFTKGQSGQLAALKLMGGTSDQMKILSRSFEDFNKITSANTFDNSAAGLGRLTKEITEMRKVDELMRKGISLTRDEIVNLVRDAERLTQQFKSEGLSAQQLDVAMKGLEEETISLARVKNELIAKTKASELAAKEEAKALLTGKQAMNDAAKATAFLERELARVDNVIQGLGTNLNITSSNRLLKFREQLKASGVDAAQAEQMLKRYEERLRTIDNTNKVKQGQAREEQLKYLARATSVQLGDIGISLAGGQNPFTVLIQQGDQLRSVLNQVEADGVEMKKALSLAFKQIVVGSKDVISALGMFVVGAFNDAGKAIFGFASAVTGLGPALETGRYQLTLLSKEAGFMGDMARKALPLMDSFGKVITTAFGAGLGASVLVLLSLGVAFVQVTNAQDNLTRAVISSGAALGLTTTQVYDLAASMGSVGATTVDAINVISKLAEGGVIGADGLKMVTKAALELENVGGRSAEKTVEIFNKLGEKPVEVLSDYAVKSGMVNQAEIARIETLVKMGEEIKATKEATILLSKATQAEAAIIYSNLSAISTLWIDIKNGTSDAWGAVQEFAGSESNIQPLVTVLQALASYGLTAKNSIQGFVNFLIEIPQMQAAIAKDAFNLDTNFTATKALKKQIEDADNLRNDSYAKEMLRINQKGEFSKEYLKQENEQQALLAKTNSDAEKSRLAHEKAMEPWRESEKKHLADVLTKEQFIANAIKEVNKGKKEGQQLDKNSKDYATVVAAAAREWEKANKGDKPKVSKEQKELENYSKKIAERVKDLGIEITGVAQELTKADKLLLDLADDETWKKLTPELQEHYRLKLLFISAQETAIKEQEKENKLNEDLTKIHNENREFINKSANESAKITDSYDLQLSLLGKSVEEQDKLTKAAALRAKIAEVEFKFSEQLVKMQEKYTAKIKEANGNQSAIFKIIGEENKERTALDEERTQNLGVLYQGVAVQASVDYYNEMQKVASELAGVISTALFEGGQAGTKKLRDYIVNLFRKKIEVWIEANILGMMSSGGSAGSNGGLAGTAQALLNIPTAISNGLSSLSAAGGISGLISTIGSSFSAGFGATISSFGAATGVAIEGGLAAVATGTSSAIAGGLAQIAGALGPLALAGVAIYGLLGGFKGEYVQSLGESVATIDSGKTSIGGSGGNNDVSIGGGLNIRQTEASDKFVTSLAQSYSTIAKSLGITNKNVSFGAGFNNSDGGKFAVETTVGNSKVYDPGQVKNSEENLTIQASRAVFAALKGSELPGYLTTLFNSFAAETATSVEIENVLKYASTLKSVREGLVETRTATQIFRESLDKAFVTLGTSADTFKTDFVAAIDKGIGPDALASWMAAGDAMAALTEEADRLAETNQSLQDKLDVLTGKQTERSLELRDATDESTKAILRQIYEQEDLRDAAEKAAKSVDGVTESLDEWLKWDKAGVSSAAQFNALKDIEDLRKEAADDYFKAQADVTQAQQNLANVLQDTVKGFKDFLGTLDNAEGPTGRLAIARKNFDDITAKARTGDTEAIGQLTGSAKTFLDLSKGYSQSIVDYRRDEAKVRAVINEGIKAAELQLGELPVELQKAKDPIKQAMDDLAKATLEETKARETAIAVQADLSRTQKTLVQRYLEAVAAMPNSKDLTDYTKATTDVTDYLEMFGLSIGLVDGKQVLLESTTGVTAGILKDLGLTLETVDGKQVLLNTATGQSADALAALGLKLGEVGGKQVILKDETASTAGLLKNLGIVVSNVDGKLVLMNIATGNITKPLDDLGLTIKSVDGKMLLLKTATEAPTQPLSDLAITLGLTNGKFKPLNDAVDKLVGTIPTAFPNTGIDGLKTKVDSLTMQVPITFPNTGIDGLKTKVDSLTTQVPITFPELGSDALKTALDNLASTIPSTLPIPEDIGAYYSGIQTSMNAALALAETSATAAANFLANLNANVEATIIAGAQGLSFNTQSGVLSKDWEGVQSSWSGAGAASILNEYGAANGTGAATARAIELGANDSILTELRKYSNGLPKFDQGTNFVPQDMDVRVHRGEAIVPAKFNNDNSEMMEMLMNKVVDRLDAMQKTTTTQNNQIIINTQKTMNRLDRLSPKGDAFDVRIIT